jgi:hypothetical protein
LTVIVARSPVAVPAAPEYAGFVTLDDDPFAGTVNVTAGAPATNVLADDTPVNPETELDCDACAVYRPAANAVVDVTDQLAPDLVAVSVSFGVPDALDPE